ncbi:IclR family transcriptional regulator [Promicromonospora iranensis]|uniref:DNA-binding IclR family transcriptional regulator n=1 Tax=Promicromonospora iranensis TaxID=1105144 RepID=A0ABU2CLW1_9MICO|nr:IclR family transcriptional regulator [Promicromonospora iranensis]MDR7382325.1 DNA-binding IclR family transcriptional regulator [Promicromonospora iranensis]
MGVTSTRPLVKSAERTVRLLEVLGASATPLTLAEIHQITGYPKSSLHELVQTLIALRWLEATPDGLAFSIGTSALLTGTAYLDADPSVPHAVRHLEELQAEVGYTAHFARLDGAHVIYLASKETTEKRHVTSRVGRKLPAASTALGRAVLAERTDAELAAILADSSGAPWGVDEPHEADLDKLSPALGEARERGYAVERGQTNPGIACVAVAVSYRIPATDAISCSLPIDRASPEELERVAGAIAAHAEALTGELRRAGVR